MKQLKPNGFVIIHGAVCAVVVGLFALADLMGYAVFGETPFSAKPDAQHTTIMRFHK
jgi:hypothetical protein